MPERIPVASIDASVAKQVFERNIRNSQIIISGEFEVALADIIEQLERPPLVEGNILPSMENAKRIARALREGFAGLPPNGFEFSTWLWDVAPLHVIKIPQVNQEGLLQGFQIGFVHLRMIASMTVEVFVEQQPQKVDSLMSLLDSSVGWLDAKNLIAYGMMSFYQRHFDDQYDYLVRMANDGKRVHAKLIPLVVAARMIVIDPSYTKAGLELLTPALDSVGEKLIHDGISYALKSAGMYGDQTMLAEYLVGQRNQQNHALIEVYCDLLNTHRIHWSDTFLAHISSTVHGWSGTVDVQKNAWMKQALDLVT